jgi:hypothetical protein
MESVRNTRITAKAAISALPNETVVNAMIMKADVPLHNFREYEWNGRDQQKSGTHRKVIIGTRLNTEKRAIRTFLKKTEHS